MEPETTQQPPQRSALKPIFWVAAVVMAIAAVFSAVQDRDWMATTGRVALVVALVLLATARPEETRAKKVAIYTLVVIAAGLLIARMMRP